MRDVTLSDSDIVYLKQRMRDYTRVGGMQIELQFEARTSHEGVAYWRVHFIGRNGLDYLLDSALYEVHCSQSLDLRQFMPAPYHEEVEDGVPS